MVDDMVVQKKPAVVRQGWLVLFYWAGLKSIAQCLVRSVGVVYSVFLVVVVSGCAGTSYE